MKKGNIGVTTENIFPIIKKFLYSDHEIFLREIVSNAVDATQKLKTLADKGDFVGDAGQARVTVSLDKDAKTLTVSDNGIGMTAEEIERYINQIAFSGVNDFLEKYKDGANSIIGHFGLGFYSSFMVSDKVEILTKSCKDGAQAVRWECDGSPEYSLTEAERGSHGTDIVMHIAEDCAEFLDKQRIGDLLRKYCRFLPVSIAFGKKTEWKDGKEVDTEEDNIINDTEPLWTKTPSAIKDEDYKAFYRKLYPAHDEPLFWIHLNVDYPFNLTGILYFPKIHSNIELQRNKIQLYCNQVFVTDQVEGIVPEFLTLLHGVIDSPDIPLNVSRSYLQSDSNVKKISTYITKKVADRLQSIFKEDRPGYEKKWDDLKLFINYGMLSQDDFYERAKDFALLKDTEGRHFTFGEYSKLVKDSQTDKDGNTVYLYSSNAEEQYAYVEAAKARGYSVLLMDGELDTPLAQMLETKLGKCQFVRVDSGTVDSLIRKADAPEETMPEDKRETLAALFNTQAPKDQKAMFNVQTQPMGADAAPVIITQNEYMRRMKDMSRFQQGMAFYGQMPDSYDITLNSDNATVKRIADEAAEALAVELNPIDAEIKARKAAVDDIRAKLDKKEYKDRTEEEKKTLADAEKALQAEEEKRTVAIAAYGKDNKAVHQLIDLAMLQNGLLKGAALDAFLKRSYQLLG